MHEMAVVDGLMGILKAQAASHGIRKINLVRVKIGRMRGLDSRQIRAGFEIFAEGTLAQGARLDIEEISAHAHCKLCGHRWELPDFNFACPSCGGHDATLDGGKELYIESFDGEKAGEGTQLSR